MAWKSRECFTFKMRLYTLKKSCILVQAEVRSKFKGPGQEEKPNKIQSSPVSGHFVLICQWGKICQLIINKTKDGNVEGLCVVLS